MRFASFITLAAVALIACPAVAPAQGLFDEDASLALRGPQSLEATTAVEEATDADVAAVIDTEQATARVAREQPLPAVEPPDDTVTGSVLRRTAVADADPYAALGIRAGGYVLYPSLTVGAGYTTNATGTAGAPGSATVTVTPELAIRSDWARHEASLTLRGAYETFLDGTTAANPTVSIDAGGRIDLEDGWAVALDGGYSFETQAISDPDFPTGVDSPPGVHGLRSSVELSGGAGPAVVALAGSVDRTIYENGTSGGSVVDQGDRTNTVFAGRLRLGYKATPALTPFVEGEASLHSYDRTVGSDGLMRSGGGQALRAGIMVDRAPVLNGEIAVGYARLGFDDPTLAALSAATVDGSLAWSPGALTTVTLRGATSLVPGADPASTGSSGRVAYDGSLDVAYAWRQNVTVEGAGSVLHERYQGTGQVDTTYTAGLGATWKANRWLYFTGRYEHEWLVSNVPGRGYESDTVRVEMRAQR